MLRKITDIVNELLREQDRLNKKVPYNNNLMKFR